jgi:hypothetical protein
MWHVASHTLSQHHAPFNTYTTEHVPDFGHTLIKGQAAECTWVMPIVGDQGAKETVKALSHGVEPSGTQHQHQQFCVLRTRPFHEKKSK